MILDFLFKLADSLIRHILSFLPHQPVGAFIAQLDAAVSTATPLLKLADSLFAVHEALGLLVVAFTLRAGAIIWFSLVWFYRKIPILGH